VKQNLPLSTLDSPSASAAPASGGVEPRLRGQLRIRPTFLALFLLLVVPVSALSLWLTYQASTEVADRMAQEAVARAHTQTEQAIGNLLRPIAAMLVPLTQTMAMEPELLRSPRASSVLLASLRGEEDLAGLFIGFADRGSYHMALKVQPEAVIGGGPAPAEAIEATRRIEQAGPGAIDRYTFFRDGGEVAAQRDQPTAYDPRQRPWYRQALATGTVVVSDPYVFATTGEVGVTLSAPVVRDGVALGAVGADLTLGRLARFLAQHRASPHATTLIVDLDGRVVAQSAPGADPSDSTDTAHAARAAGAAVTPRNLEDLADKGPATAWLMRARLGGQASFSYQDPLDGRRMMASFVTLPIASVKHWQVMILAPRSDFTRDLDAAGLQVLGILLGALLLQILLIHRLLPWITRPLELLAHRVKSLRRLEFDASMPAPDSRVREIATLSQAVQTLGVTVNAFASFVPRDMVRQLIDSGQGLAAGGRSRFLTILFTDLEGFSSLAERHPAQALLRQVSEYFGIATRSIGREQGTVDKFIGDAVMAFWGAPQLLEDHAWRACVAALRIQRQVQARNAQWVHEGLEPLVVRIGIHCDAVLVGNIGSADRMSYTVMGDGVNVASRLEGLNKEYGTRLCVSQTVFREAGERLWLRPLDIVAVKGRRAELEVYELMGAREADDEVAAPPEVQQLCTQSLAAFEHLRAGRWAEAAEGYAAVCAAWPEDAVSPRLLERCRQRASAALAGAIKPRG
jgi:adenylate cyclase